MTIDTIERLSLAFRCLLECVEDNGSWFEIRERIFGIHPYSLFYQLTDIASFGDNKAIGWCPHLPPFSISPVAVSFPYYTQHKLQFDAFRIHKVQFSLSLSLALSVAFVHWKLTTHLMTTGCIPLLLLFCVADKREIFPCLACLCIIHTHLIYFMTFLLFMFVAVCCCSSYFVVHLVRLHSIRSPSSSALMMNGTDAADMMLAGCPTSVCFCP